MPVPEPGKYRVALDSDAWDYGGEGRVGWDVDHFSEVGWRRARGVGEGLLSAGASESDAWALFGL